MNTEIVVVDHSGYGHTKRVAAAVARGAKASTVAIERPDLPHLELYRAKLAERDGFGLYSANGQVEWRQPATAPAPASALDVHH